MQITATQLLFDICGRLKIIRSAFTTAIICNTRIICHAVSNILILEGFFHIIQPHSMQCASMKYRLHTDLSRVAPEKCINFPQLNRRRGIVRALEWLFAISTHTHAQNVKRATAQIQRQQNNKQHNKNPHCTHIAAEHESTLQHSIAWM